MSNNSRQNINLGLLSGGVVERFRDSVFQTHIQNVPDFFGFLARVTAKTLGARHVDIWDNNVYGKCMVHLASYPVLNHQKTSKYQTLSRQHSLTGLAVERCDVVVIPDVNKPYAARRLNYPEAADELGVSRLISVPIFNVFDNQLVMCVVNLLYGPQDIGPFDPIHPERLTDESNLIIEWLAWSLGTSIHYLLLRVDKNIQARTDKADVLVREHIEGLPSTRGLFQHVSADLQSVTQSDDVRFYLWKTRTEELTLEYQSRKASELRKEGPRVNRQDYRDNLLDVATKALPLITCIEQKKSPDPPACSRLNFMAMPILSKSGEVLGVIQCTNARRETFSSYNIFALETFARELAPHLERLLRLREDSTFSLIIRRVVEVIARGSYLTSQILQEVIDIIVDVLHAETGAIFLAERDTDGKSRLIMRAGATDNKPLVDVAKYEIGEGITGTIAKRKLVIRFDNTNGDVDLTELGWKGKYNADIWPDKKITAARTFLGVPILSGQGGDGEILGVWKVENIERTNLHPDPFFTPDDGRMAMIVSSFLAYVIQNEREHHRTLQQLEKLAAQSICLAESTIRIEEEQSEPEAIRAVIEELTRAGWGHAMVSLYDPQTNRIKGADSSWPEGEILVEMTDRDADGNDILAWVLHQNRPEFIVDSPSDKRCNLEAINFAEIHSQFILPLVVGSEKIGTLQVGMGIAPAITDDDKLVLTAFAKHLSIAISRIRSINHASSITNQIVRHSRFVAAAEMASLTVHGLKHRLNSLIKYLEDELKKPDRRSNSFVFNYLEDILKKFRDEKRAIDETLTLVKGEFQVGERIIDLHEEIQRTLDIWIRFLHNNRSHVQLHLDAKQLHTSFIASRSFGEILAILLVNSSQAFARQIDIRTYNATMLRLPTHGMIIPSAFCMDISDDGHGIGGFDPEMIFDHTFTTKPDAQGTGLGLFIGRLLARNAGGDLFVAPTHSRSRGVTFRLAVPLDL